MTRHNPATHACPNCDGIDPASCLTNPDRRANKAAPWIADGRHGPTPEEAAAGLAAPTNHNTETQAPCCDVQVWPLARVLRDVRCGSNDWTWGEEWVDLDKRHAATGYLDALEQQIRADGITMPVLIGSDGRLWDGHHRLRIAVRLGIGYVPVEVAPRAILGGLTMTRHNPADTLRAAAEMLQRHATAAETKRPGRWYPGAAGSVISLRKGGVDYVTPHTISDGAEVSRYIAIMGPDVGRVLADWLAETATEVTAAEGTEYALLAHEPTNSWTTALTVARTLLGEASEAITNTGSPMSDKEA